MKKAQWGLKILFVFIIIGINNLDLSDFFSINIIDILPNFFPIWFIQFFCQLNVWNIVNFVLFALKESIGQEIFVPKLPSYNIMNLARAVSSLAKIRITGIRKGEKLHEEMITISDSYNTIETKKYYIILPSNLKNSKN